MQGMSHYASMSDDEKEDERFSDEMEARGDEEIAARPTSPSRKSSSNPEKKKKRKSRKPSSREGMTEEELMASARRSRESAKMAESAGLVIPPGAPAGTMSTREATEGDEGKAGRRSTRQSASRSQPGSTPGAHTIVGPGGVDEAVQLTNYDADEEDPFNRISRRAPPQDRASAAPQPRASAQQKKEINKDFKDVRETGRWGSISKREMYIVGIVVLLVIIGVVVAVVVVTTGGDDPAPAPASANAATPPPAPTAAPTATVVLTAQQQLDTIRAATIDNPATQGSLASLPEDVSFYEGKATDPTAAPVVRAASWIMYDDPIDNEEWLMVRYGLAVLYYTTNGDSWTTKDKWLTEVSACEWYGIRCDRFNKAVEEIDLSSNNLSGVIPGEINMVSSLISLWLRGNNLSGNVPNLALGAIPQLSILYLNNNGFNGTIGPELAASGTLRTLFLQGNELTGVLPYELCTQRDAEGLREFGIDCLKMECLCCDPGVNCF